MIEYGMNNYGEDFEIIGMIKFCKLLFEHFYLEFFLNIYYVTFQSKNKLKLFNIFQYVKKLASRIFI